MKELLKERIKENVFRGGKLKTTYVDREEDKFENRIRYYFVNKKLFEVYLCIHNEVPNYRGEMDIEFKITKDEIVPNRIFTKCRCNSSVTPWGMVSEGYLKLPDEPLPYKCSDERLKDLIELVREKKLEFGFNELVIIDEKYNPEKEEEDKELNLERSCERCRGTFKTKDMHCDHWWDDDEDNLGIATGYRRWHWEYYCKECWKIVKPGLIAKWGEANVK